MQKKYILPPKESVLPNGRISPVGIEETENMFGIEKLTDLRDIDYSALRNPEIGYIYFLGYRPQVGNEKKFAFFPVRDPAYKPKEEK